MPTRGVVLNHLTPILSNGLLRRAGCVKDLLIQYPSEILRLLFFSKEIRLFKLRLKFKANTALRRSPLDRIACAWQ